MKERVKFGIMTVLGLLLLLALPSCKVDLDPAGVYQGDRFLYHTDQTLKLQKQALNTFVTWEYNNRKAIQVRWPSVTLASMRVRRDSPDWFAWAGMLRADYVTVRQTLHGLTNSPSLDQAKSNLTFQVTMIGQKVGSAQAEINTTTLTTKPQLKGSEE